MARKQKGKVLINVNDIIGKRLGKLEVISMQDIITMQLLVVTECVTTTEYIVSVEQLR